MYDFIDRPVSALDNDGRFLLWAMRGWVDSAARGNCPAQALGRAFAGFNAAPALPDFHLAMALLSRRAGAPLLLAPMGCCRIAEHEALLLALWRDVGIGRRENVRATLAHVVPSDTVAAIAQALCRASAAMTIAGFGMALINPLKIED
jgi:transcriptional regulator of nitric oxide reductase